MSSQCIRSRLNQETIQAILRRTRVVGTASNVFSLGLRLIELNAYLIPLTNHLSSTSPPSMTNN
jgi:hypothetical protein